MRTGQPPEPHHHAPNCYNSFMLPILLTASQLIIALVGALVCGVAAGKLSNRRWLGWLVAATVLIWQLWRVFFTTPSVD
jgi:hypothetical protein